MGLLEERLVPITKWEKVFLKPWHIVANAKKLVEKDYYIRRAFDQGATHVWVRYLGYKLVITVFNMQTEDERTPVDKVIAGKGFWFAKSGMMLYHCLPVIGDLPNPVWTAIANVDY